MMYVYYFLIYWLAFGMCICLCEYVHYVIYKYWVVFYNSIGVYLNINLQFVFTIQL